MPVRDAAGHPALKEMISARQLGGAHHTFVKASARANEEDEPAAFGHASDDAARAAEMRGCHVQRDDVNALPDAEDVARVHWVPEGGVVA